MQFLNFRKAPHCQMSVHYEVLHWKTLCLTKKKKKVLFIVSVENHIVQSFAKIVDQSYYTKKSREKIT